MDIASDSVPVHHAPGCAGVAVVDMDWARYFDPAEIGGSTTGEIAELTGRNINAVRRKMGELLRAGLVRRATKRIEGIDGTWRHVASYVFVGGGE